MQHCPRCEQVKIYESRVQKVTSIEFIESYADMQLIISWIRRMYTNESNRNRLVETCKQYDDLTEKYRELETLLVDKLFISLYMNLSAFPEYNLFPDFPNTPKGPTAGFKHYNRKNRSLLLKEINDTIVSTKESMGMMMQIHVVREKGSAYRNNMRYNEYFNAFDASFDKLKPMLDAYIQLIRDINM